METIQIKFKTSQIRDLEIEEIRELIEDYLGVEILEINKK